MINQVWCSFRSGRFKKGKRHPLPSRFRLHFHFACLPPFNAHANAQALARVPNVPTHTCVPYFLCRPSVSITVFFNISIVKNPFGLQSDSPLAVAADATVAPGQSTHLLLHCNSASLHRVLPSLGCPSTQCTMLGWRGIA